MFNWFRRKPTTTQVATPASAEPLAPASGLETEQSEQSSRAAARRATNTTPPPVTVSSLWEVITERVQQLLADIPEVHRKTDAPAVLQMIGESLDTSIGQPPYAAQRALTVSRNPNSSVDDLAKLFASDPGLAQSLLTHANSSFYAGVGDHCTSLASAIQRIGSSGVESVLLSNTVRGVLCRPGGRYDGLVDQVWFHMVRSGPIARQIAPAFGVEPERAFSMALLHDAGKLVVFEQVSNYRRNNRREVTLPEELLLKALMRLHEPVGGLAALRWGLEERATRAIANHHRSPVPQFADPLGEVIFLAERIDLAAVNGKPLDLDALWESGGLTGDASVLRNILGEDQRLAA